jgi:hypothetical protein
LADVIDPFWNYFFFLASELMYSTIQSCAKRTCQCS